MFGQLSKTKHKASLWSLRTHWKICSLCFWAGSSSHAEYNDIVLIYPPEPAHHVLCSTKRISPESERFVANKACLLGTAPSQVSYVLPQAGKKDPSQLQRINHKVVKKTWHFSLRWFLFVCIVTLLRDQRDKNIKTGIGSDWQHMQILHPLSSKLTNIYSIWVERHQ